VSEKTGEVSEGALDGSTSGRRPNIIWIMTDDLGYRELGCYGQEVIETPNLDRMAAEGMRFTDCYTGSPISAPCRSVLMTGLHSGHTRVRNNFARVGGTPPQGRVPLRPEDVTVAEVLQAAGYTTGITGKWGLAEPGTEGVPNKKGFDEWFGYLNQRRAHSYYPDYLWHNEVKVELEENRDGARGTWSHDLVAEFGLDFIRRHANQPFFLYCAWTLPHGHYQIPDLGQWATRDWPEDDKAYAAMVGRIDRDVQDIQDLLKELGIDRQTIVFFCSDNGAARRCEGMFDSCGELHGQKGDVYEGGIRTPMIVRCPGLVPAGVVSDTPWYFTDFMATATDIAGAELPERTDGLSVLPTLLGREQDLHDRAMYWELLRDVLHQGARRGEWKAVRHGLDAPVELYRLDHDPGEQTDVAGENAPMAAEFAEILDESHEESPHWPD
jgi:arylsulfatase A-like enzyme